jgi:predicted transcriptional regulator
LATTTTIRVPMATRERLQRLASEQSRPIGRIIDTLLDDYEKREFFAGLGEDFARLRADADALKSYEEEVAVWDATLKDGLDDDWIQE